MNFTIEQDKGATIFRPKEKRLDSLISSELKAEFLILAQSDVEKLIIDLTEVEYIDSGGLSALLLARRQMVDNEGDVRLVGVRPEVQSLLSLTQLDRVFPTYTTIAEAVAAPQLSLVSIPPGGGVPKLWTPERVAAAAVGTSALAGMIVGPGLEEGIIDVDDDDDEEDEDDDLLDIEEYEGDEEELDDDDDDEDEDVVEPVVVEDEDEYVEDDDEEEEEDEQEGGVVLPAT